MPSWLPSIKYPPPGQPGYWQPVTSTIQWCEEDYYVSYYSAEIINTFTNLMYMYLAYRGMKSCHKYGHDTVFSVAYLGYLLVGIGSFLFHSTLKYPWQLMDEMNMIYTTCLMVYVSLSYERTVKAQLWLGGSLSLFCGGVTLYYHYLQDPVFHQTVYAGLTVFIVFRSAFQMESSLRPSLRKTEEKHRAYRVKQGLPIKSKAQQEFDNQRDLKILKDMWKFVAFGLTVFLSGFALWGMDIAFCRTLRTWRRSIGMPWGFFLELHGWWHLLTGIGAYCYIVWGIHLRYVLDGDQDKFVMQWPNFWTLPEIVPATPRTNGVAMNGHSEKKVNGSAAKVVNGNAKKRV